MRKLSHKMFLNQANCFAVTRPSLDEMMPFVVIAFFCDIDYFNDYEVLNKKVTTNSI